MKIYSVSDPEFRPYGRVLNGYDTADLTAALEEKTPLPEGVTYTPSEPALECLPVLAQIRDQIYGGMPVQLGWCNGHNTKLNCLEYHRDSEINIGTGDFILLLAHEWEIQDGVLDTACVRAFRVPAATAVEVYATTMHYAPCQVDNTGFRVAVALPKGTNEPLPESVIRSGEGRLLTARNKWLLAHPDSAEAKSGAFVGLTGANLDVVKDL